MSTLSLVFSCSWFNDFAKVASYSMELIKFLRLRVFIKASIQTYSYSSHHLEKKNCGERTFYPRILEIPATTIKGGIIFFN